MQKRLIFIIICFVVSISLLGFFFYSTAANKNKYNTNSELIKTYTSQAFGFENIDELIAFADTIVIGTIEEEIDFSLHTGKNRFAVDKILKGNITDSFIYVYETKGTFALNDRYLLFLQSCDASLYPEITYTAIEDESIVQIGNGGNLVGNAKYIDNDLNEEKIVQHIENSSSVKINTNNMIRFTFKDKADSIDELISESDYILQFIPEKVSNHNIYVNTAKGTIVNQYKGEPLNKETTFFLPPDMIVGNEYLLFLRKCDSAILPTVREGYFFDKEKSTEWDSVLKALNKK